MKHFFHISILLAIIFATHAGASAQSTKQRAAAIKYARATLVSRLEKGMPRERFDAWFRRLAGEGMKITWEINDCGEQTGTAADKGRDFPMCVEAIADSLDVHIAVGIMVGTFKRGITGKPVVRNLTLNVEGEEAKPVDNLADLKKQLQLL